LTRYMIISKKHIVISYKPLVKAEALIIENGRVVDHGSVYELEHSRENSGVEKIVVDKIVAPSFIDAHMHIDSLGFELSTIDLSKAKSIDELLAKLRDVEPNVGEWIVGGRFDHLVFRDNKPPTRMDLDKVSRDHPMLLIHRSGHMGVLNSIGLEMIIDKVDHRLVDQANGWVFENALWRVREHIFNEMELEKRVSMFRKAIQYLKQHGIGVVGVAGCNMNCIDTLKRLDEEGSLDVYTYVYMYYSGIDEVEDLVKYARSINSYSHRSRINGFKIIADGALGPRTAYLSEPYNDDPGNFGIFLHDQRELETVIELIDHYGFQIAIHCIGDAALDIILKIYRKLGENVSINRHRVEHASLTRPDQISVIRELKPVVVVQPHFILTDTWILERVGLERASYIYPFKSLYDATVIAFSTDAPVEPVDPFETIYAAVTRGVYEGLKHGELTLDQRLSMIEALHSYTYGSAYALKEDALGCLDVGCVSSMIMLDRDPLTVTDLRDVRYIKPITMDLW